MENRVRKRVLPPKRNHVVPARAPLRRAAYAGAIGTLNQAVAIQVATAHGVEALENSLTVTLKPAAIRDASKKIGKPAHARRIRHQILIGGIVRHAFMHQPTGGIARASIQPSFQRRPQQLGRMKARQDLRHRQRHGRPRIQADGTVHRSAVVAERAGVRAIRQRSEVRPLHRAPGHGGRVRAERPGRELGPQRECGRETATPQPVQTFGGAALPELEFEGVDVGRAMTVASHGRFIGVGGNLPRAEARQVQQHRQLQCAHFTVGLEPAQRVRRRNAVSPRDRPD